MINDQDALPPDHPDWDDGASEVVAHHARRAAAPIASAAEVARARPSGLSARLIEAGVSHRRDFILMRRAGAPVVRIALPHIGIYKALWSLWSAKRASGLDDPGVTIGEVASEVKLASDVVGRTLRSLTQSGAARSVHTRLGARAQSLAFYPTSEGAEAFALAEYLGDGALVQVGRATKSWKSRTTDEPANLFQHAALISGRAANRPRPESP